MGWCAEFGCRIRDGCDHTMVAGRKACTCPDCAVVCKGRFTGCPEVWAAGPRTGSQPVLKLATKVGSSARLRRPGRLRRPLDRAPAPVEPVAVVLPPDERITVVLDSIRLDVEGMHGDLNDTIAGVKQLRDAVDDMGRTASANIESLRRELASVTQLLTRQQATLDKLMESQAAGQQAQAARRPAPPTPARRTRSWWRSGGPRWPHPVPRRPPRPPPPSATPPTATATWAPSAVASSARPAPHRRSRIPTLDLGA